MEEGLPEWCYFGGGVILEAAIKATGGWGGGEGGGSPAWSSHELQQHERLLLTWGPPLLQLKVPSHLFL